MTLTKRQREILEFLNSDADDADLVEAGREVWFGLNRTNISTLKFFLRMCLVSHDEFSGNDCQRYHINGWGRKALTDPSFDPARKIAELVLKTENAGAAP